MSACWRCGGKVNTPKGYPASVMCKKCMSGKGHAQTRKHFGY